jgi:hypothetical protein
MFLRRLDSYGFRVSFEDLCSMPRGHCAQFAASRSFLGAAPPDTAKNEYFLDPDARQGSLDADGHVVEIDAELGARNDAGWLPTPSWAYTTPGPAAPSQRHGRRQPGRLQWLAVEAGRRPGCPRSSHAGIYQRRTAAPSISPTPFALAKRPAPALGGSSGLHPPPSYDTGF